MKILKEHVNIVTFINTVKKCEKDVYLKTNEGDSLNLKSSLCQYIFAFASNTDSSAFFRNAAIQCESEDDYLLLSDFITDRPDEQN